jgi:hypothetical protein
MGKPMTKTNNMSGAAARTVGHATSSVHRAIDKASDAARPAVGHITAGAHQAVDKLAGATTLAIFHVERFSAQGYGTGKFLLSSDFC